MQDKTRAVMVGCGSMAAAWLDSAQQIGVEIVGFVDIDENAAIRRRDHYNPAAPVGVDLTTMLEKTTPDVVFDCTLPHAHYDVTLKALRFGCHVMGEKPMSDSIEHAREMVATAKSTGKIYAVIQNQRYRQEIRRMRHFLQSGAVGTLNTLSCDFVIGAHFGGFRDHMNHVLVLDMAIHTFDAARYLCGLDPVSVYCKDWNPAGSWYDHGASAIAIFTMANGVVFTYQGSWCAEGLNTEWTGSWRFQATGGAATWDGANGYLAAKPSEDAGFVRATQAVSIPEFVDHGKTRGHRDLIEEFVNSIRTGRVPETYCADNIKSVAMVLAAVESAEAGREVPVVW